MRILLKVVPHEHGAHVKLGIARGFFLFQCTWYELMQLRGHVMNLPTKFAETVARSDGASIRRRELSCLQESIQLMELGNQQLQ